MRQLRGRSVFLDVQRSQLSVLVIALVMATSAPRGHADPAHDQLVAAYHQAIRAQGYAPDDFAVGFATFLAGCHMAYANADAPADDQFRKLVDTLRPSSDQMVAQLTPQQRTQTLDYFIVTGMGFIGQRMQLAQRPDAAKTAALREQVARQLQMFEIEPQTLATMFGALGPPTTPARGTPPPAAPASPSSASSPSPRKEFEVERGKGIGTAQVVALLHSWWTGTSMYQDATYVLFKDGTVREMPDIALDSFDAASERVAKPQRWGRWQRQGSEYALRMGSSNSFSVPSHPELFKPGRTGDTFTGTFEKHSSSFNSYHSSYITLDASHRFSQSWSGGVQSIGVAGDFGTPTITSTYNQDGAATTVSGNNIGGGTSRRNHQQADRQGTYHVDGYTIELRYDSGRVERRPFYVSANRKQIGIGTTAYWLEKK